MRPGPYDDAIADLEDARPDLAIARDVLLARYTTFGIGGPADAMVFAHDDDQLVEVLKFCRDRGVPWFLLGGGSNLLIADAGVRGVVLRLAGDLARIDVLDDGAAIAVGAGAKFPKLTRVALDLGWPSAVGWMGTPGQVGGALKMNAGTRDGEVGEVVERVQAATADGVVSVDHAGCGFVYRNSAFPAGWVLTRADLRCDSHRTEEAPELSRRAKMLLQKRHQSQPKQRSAGSLFKNPPGDFAGRLIEAAGLKGAQEGQAAISDVHANFVVNLGGARAADVLALATRAAREVKAQFGVDLEWEVKRVGDFSA